MRKWQRRGIALGLAAAIAALQLGAEPVKVLADAEASDEGVISTEEGNSTEDLYGSAADAVDQAEDTTVVIDDETETVSEESEDADVEVSSEENSTSGSSADQDGTTVNGNTTSGAGEDTGTTAGAASGTTARGTFSFIEQDGMYLPLGGIEEPAAEAIPEDEDEVSLASTYEEYTGDALELEIELSDAIREALLNGTFNNGVLKISLSPYQDQYRIPYDGYEDLSLVGHLCPYVGGGITATILYYVGAEDVPDSWAYVQIHTDKTQEELAAHVAEVDAALEEIYAQIDDSMTDVQKALTVHDYICSQVTYDLNADPTDMFHAYGALMDQRAVCMGYAHLYAYIMNSLGLRCYYVSSSSMNHGWNILQLGDNYYQVDCTWDDPVNSTSGDFYYGGATHKYFLLSDATIMDANHNHSGWDHTEYVCGDTSYESEFWTAITSPILFEGDDAYYLCYVSADTSAGLFCRDENGTTERLDSFRWNAWENNGYWPSCYSGLFRQGDYLIYNTPTQIKAYDLTDGSLAVAAEPDTSTGYIYGSRLCRGQVLYQLRTAYYETNDPLTVELNLQYPVKTLTLDRSSMTLEPGEDQQLTAEFSPACTTDTGVWSSSDDTVVAVSEQGLVTAQGIGTAEITFTMGSLSATCAVKVAHSNETVVKNAKAATCLEDGYTGDTCCAGCGQILKTGSKVAAFGHKALTPVKENETAADCEQEGSYEMVTRCSVCGEELSREKTTVKAPGHNADEGRRVDEKAAGCTEEGSYTEVVSCQRCGKILSSVVVKIPALGHDWDEGKVTREAACTTAGEKTYSCSRCEETKTEAIAATGHDYKVSEKEADCVSGGYTLHVCSLCGDQYKTGETAALGHDWDEGKVTKEVTCTTDGEKTYSCSRCEETKTEVIPAPGHKALAAVKENETAADCEQEGSYEMVTRCSVCGEELTREKITVKALGHNADEGKRVDEKAAGCTEEGSYTEVVSCQRCGKILSSVVVKIPALGHDWDEGKVTKEVTCTTDGEKTYSCSNCGETRTEEISALGHNWNETYTIDSKASASAEGSKSIHCSRCDERKDEIAIPIAGITLTNKSATYSGKAISIGSAKTVNTTGTVSYTYYRDAACTSKTTAKASGASANGKAPKYAGTYYVKATAAADEQYETISATAKLTIKKKAPTITVKVTSKKISYSKVNTKAQTFAIGASVTGSGTLTYKKYSGSSCLKVNAKTGKITVAKKTKKGTYKIKVKITAAASTNYSSKTAYKTIKVVVK